MYLLYRLVSDTAGCSLKCYQHFNNKAIVIWYVCLHFESIRGDGNKDFTNNGLHLGKNRKHYELPSSSHFLKKVFKASSVGYIVTKGTSNYKNNSVMLLSFFLFLSRYIRHIFYIKGTNMFAKSIKLHRLTWAGILCCHFLFLSKGYSAS